MKTIDLKTNKEKFNKAYSNLKKRVIICAGTGCIANGSLKIHDEIIKIINEKGLDIATELNYHDCDDDMLISGSGCQGFCQVGPLVTILPDNILYNKVKIEDVEEIVNKSLLDDQIIERLLFKNQADNKTYKGIEDIPFYTQQSRTVIDMCGKLDPEDIIEYIGLGGYESAKNVFTQLTSAETCKVVKDAKMRGRGGGGFSTGLKWELTLANESDKKYIICNGDEGDPGAFMDRSILEGNPHSVIEGMMIAAHAIDADEGYIYIRMEYPLAVKRMRKAIKDAEEMGLLGENIFGSNRSLKLQVKEGAGAFVCGEETALIASIEGLRGMPRPKPPFPAEKGLFNKPTSINNVETLSAIPYIFNIGAENFRKIGTEDSPGTKTFALTGHVANTGLIEVPFGTTIRQILFDIGGGVTKDDGTIDNDSFKAVQIGGPSGGCLTKDHLDIPLDFDSLKSIGAMVGSGGLVAMNDKTCIVQIAKFFMQFTQNESCGKCVPCREGTKQMLELLDDIIEGRATQNTIRLLEETAITVQKASLCGLGKSAPSPILSTLKYFREEYDMHVDKQVCPTGKCQALTTYQIDSEKCIGCTLCAKKCPVDAIAGDLKQPHTIDVNKCIKCGVCVESCKFKAISQGA